MNTSPAPDKGHSFRERAEEKLQAREDLSPEALGPEETRRLLHELRVHQIELEMQNEELHRAQEELEASRARYVDLYDFAPVGYVTVSEAGLILEANLTAATLLGVNRSALVRQPLTRFILPEDGDIHYHHCQQLFETGAPQVYELRMARPGGPPFWARLETTAARDGESGPPVCRVTISDVTQRKLAEEARRESNALNESLLRTIPFPMNIVDAQGRVLFVSARMEQGVGKSAVGERCWDLYRDDRQPCVDCPLRQPIQVGKTSSVESAGVLGGRVCEIFHTGMIYQGKAALMEIFLDVTERVRAEEALHESEDTLQTVTNGAPSAIIMMDGDGRIILFNPAAERMFGYSSAEMLGQPVHELLMPPDLCSQFREKFPAFRQTGQGAAIGRVSELRAVRKGGSEFPMELALAAVRKKGQWQAVGVIRDISDWKRAREQLDKAMAELKRSNAELEQFASVVSHDLQEPLRMVASYVQLLAGRYQDRLDSDANEFIAYAVEGAARMKNMINALLMYSRVGRQDQELSPVNCEAALNESLANLEAAITENSTELTHDPLPTAVANADQLAHVFQNLIGNAIKFHGQEPPRIHVSARLNGEEWIFSVRDNGIGLNQEHADRIFQMFQRLHSREEYPGMGIGLAISKKIVEHHGGRIWVESEPGKGAAFYFTIPARVPDGKV